MRRITCTYCTLRNTPEAQPWIKLELGGATELGFCSLYCLADWAAEQESAARLRVTA